MMKLDANENAFDRILLGTFLNRYPDPDARALKEAYADFAKVSPDALVCGNGSDELIDLLFAVYGSGETIVTMAPDFSMYPVYAKKYKATLKRTEDFSAQALLNLANASHAKLIVFSNPNNPTGRVMALSEIESLLNGFAGTVVIDEAYVEFYGISCAPLVARYPRLVVTRTCSKALGLAGLRVGFAICSEESKRALEAIRSPYNVSALSQLLATQVLKAPEKSLKEIESIQSARTFLYQGLSAYFSERDLVAGGGNYLYIRSEESASLNDAFNKKGIQVRAFKGALRITVGRMEEVLAVLGAVKEWRESDAKGILQAQDARNAG